MKNPFIMNFSSESQSARSGSPLFNKRTISVLLCCVTGVTPLSAQEEASGQNQIEIPVPISDGTPAEPAPEPDSIDFRVIRSRSRLIDVVKAPEMAGLPPITGTIRVTVEMVEDPNLPPPLPRVPALAPDDPVVIARLAALQENYQGTEMIFVSATVYDHSRTFLRIYPSGRVEGAISAWTNIDFNHFSGFSTYRVTEPDASFRDYGLLMGVGDIDTGKIAKLLNSQGYEYTVPEIPDLFDLRLGGPEFVVTGGDRDGKAMEILEQIHDLYRKEGLRMEEAYYARKRARAKRKAYLLANPPKPEDVTIRFWKRTAKVTNQQEDISR